MLLASELHRSLQDPVLESINFLNEVVGKYPHAISFAPGAPSPVNLSDTDVEKYINRYLKHLCDDRGLKLEQARAVLYNYGPSGGLINDIVAAAFKRDRGVDITPESFVITVGAQEAILIVLRALFGSSQARLAVITPCYTGIIGAARLLDINVIGIDETEHGIDLKHLSDLCRSAQRCKKPIRALYVAPDFANPTGTLLDIDQRQQLLALAETHNFLLLEDNAYAFTAPLGKEIPTLKSLDKSKRVVFLGTFAKSCLPAARVGYVIADQLVINNDTNSHYFADDLVKVKSMTTLNTSPICQALIGGMILEYGGSIAALEQEKTNIYQRNLTVLLNALERHLKVDAGISWNRPKGGFFVRLRIPVLADMALLKCSAADYGVLWTPMSFFHLSNIGNNELRLSISYLSPEQIEEGVGRLAAFLHHVVQKRIK